MSTGPEHGSLGEEAARLAEAVQEWLAGAGGQRARDVWAEATSHLAESPECRVCPVCQLLRLLRSTRPETFEHLSDAVASFVSALHDLVAEAPAAGDQRRGGVERIDLG